MIFQKQCYPPDNLAIGSDACCEMREAVQSAYPEEACGVLLGCRKTGTVKKVMSLENRSGKDISGWYYRIDPLDLYRLERGIESEEFEMLGFYHSHVNAEAVLSDVDEENMIPGMIYTILPVFNGKPGRISAYWKSEIGGKAAGICIKLEERERQ